MDSCNAETVAFVKLKIACNHLMQTPSQESADRLIEIVNNVPVPSLLSMHSHILFVLLQQLQQKEIRSNIKIKIAQCLKLVLIRCKPLTMEPSLLDNLLLCFVGVMYNPESDNLVTENPEELHTICLKCMTMLLCQTKPKERAYLYSAKRAPLLGVLVCVCLKQATTQQYRELKIVAMECLMACGQVLDKAQMADQELKVQASNIFMNFTPGIAAGLQQVICADEKQGHAVTVVALRAWGRLLAQVLNEETLPAETPLFSENEMISMNSLGSAKTSAEIANLLMKSERTAAWLCHADAKLAGNVSKVCSVLNHSHHKVRLELVYTSELLLTKCSRAVPQCVPPLLEVLVTLAQDAENEVSSAAGSALQLVACKCEGDLGKPLAEILEESFFNITSSLAANFIYADTNKQSSSLGLLLGYLNLLGPRLPEVLLLYSHCESLVQALLQVATLDCTSILLLEDVAIRDVSCDVVSQPWCRFRYFSDARVKSKLCQVCHTLGSHADLGILCEQLLKVFHEKAAQRREATFLLNQILSTAYPGKPEEQFSIVKTVLRAYLDPCAWDIPLSMQDENFSLLDITTLAVIRGNVVQACLMAEGVSLLTANTGNLARRLLAQVLYPILERAGSPLDLVSQAGRHGLAVLASALGHASAAQLIEQESDYFSHTVEMRLKRPRDNPNALLVLSAVLTHSNKDILPCIHQLISNVLVQSCDAFQEKSMNVYLHIFHTFLLNLQRWLRDEQQTTSNNEEIDFTKTSKPSAESILIQELRLHHKWKVATGEEDEKETEIENNDVDTMVEAEQEKQIPEYVKMTEAVMFRCIHALPSRNRDSQLLAMSTLKLGIQILASHEDQLLPMAHKIWSPLLQRFSSNQDIVVLRQSFELLCIMAHVAKDFLRKRTLDKVLPNIANFLSKQSIETRKQRSYSFSQSVKLQQVALERLGQLVEDLDMQEEAVDLILQATAPYLSSYQPPNLQESCVGLFRQLAHLHPDAVWLQLRMLWNPEPELTSSHPSCPVIRFPHSTIDAAEFKKNIQVLDAEI